MKPGGQPSMQQVMKQAQQMQRQMMAAQEELSRTEVEGSAGGGLVTARVTGSGELVSLQIDRSVVDPDDVETLTDLVIAAMRDASRAVSEIQAEKLGPLATGAGIPGLG